ncbi:MAG: DHHA1 domain-containing protein [Patescibacteria group bacterium]|nr:DHHA1 domain-containing protein [Patescibacteria group bacterium]
MEATPKQQAIELITQANSILLVPSALDGDSLGSSLGLFRVLKKLGKQIAVISLESPHASYRFLPHIHDLRNSLEGGRDFVITLDNATVETDKLSYNFDNGKLNVIIATKKGQFKPEDVSFTVGSVQYDLIITLDAASLSHLGEIYKKHEELFKETPVINIDHHASNDYFGKVNLVNMTAASTAEILVGLIEALGSNLLDDDVATCLLTAMIADTNSFQNPNTTPKALTVAAQMVGFGARQQEIIKNIYRTKSLGALQLWGRVLARAQSDTEYRLVWTTANLDDLSATGATQQDLSGLIDEFLSSVPDTDVAILISEREPGIIHGSIRTNSDAKADEIAKLFGGGGHPGAAAFKLPKSSLEQAATEIIDNIKTYQAERLNLASHRQNVQKDTPVEENSYY